MRVTKKNVDKTGNRAEIVVRMTVEDERDVFEEGEIVGDEKVDDRLARPDRVEVEHDTEPHTPRPQLAPVRQVLQAVAKPPKTRPQRSTVEVLVQAVRRAVLGRHVGVDDGEDEQQQQRRDGHKDGTSPEQAGHGAGCAGTDQGRTLQQPSLRRELVMGE